jgi:hypothetical protein
MDASFTVGETMGRPEEKIGEERRKTAKATLGISS